MAWSRSSSRRTSNIAAALAQVTAASQTVLKLLPPGITPPYVLSYNASSVPILQLALSSKKLPQMQLFDLGQNFIRPQLATVAGAAVPSPYGGKVLQVQVDLDQQAMQAHNVSADDVVNAISVQNLILPAGDEKIGKFDWNVALNASPTVLEKINDLPVKKVNGTIIYMRDVAYVHQGSPPQTNLVRVNGSRAVLMTILKAGSASTLQRHRRHQIAAAAGRGEPAAEPQPAAPSATSRSSSKPRCSASSARPRSPPRWSALMILIFLGSWRSTVIILIEIPLAILFSLDRAVLARRDDQRHDARRPGARRRHPGRRRHRDDREHQLPSRTGQSRSSRRSWTARSRSSFPPS